jgi:hypothetical protein
MIGEPSGFRPLTKLSTVSVLAVTFFSVRMVV